MDYSWPGNVRELENTIERAVLIGDGPELLVHHLDFLLNSKTETNQPQNLANMLLQEELDACQLPENGLDLNNLNKSIILKALDKFDGNKSQTAKYLGLSRGALRNRLDSFDDEA